MPERSDLIVELPVLSGELRVVPLRERVQDVRTAVGEAIDLSFDVFQSTHVVENAPWAAGIPDCLDAANPLFVGRTATSQTYHMLVQALTMRH